MNLTQKVLYFQQGCWSCRNLLLHIRNFCAKLLKIRKALMDSELEEFFDYLEPKLLRAVMRFRFTGRRFEAYLKKIVFFQLRSYISCLKEKSQHQGFLEGLEAENYQKVEVGNQLRVATDPGQWPESVHAGERSSYGCIDPGEFSINFSTHPISDCIDVSQLSPEQKSVLLLGMKNADALDDKMINKISRFTGVSEMRLLAMKQELYSGSQEKSARRKSMIERRNGRYMKLIRPESMHSRAGVQKVSPDERVRRANERIRLLTKSYTHREISRVTGIPKGTVDSNLYGAPKRLQTLSGLRNSAY